MLTRTDLRHRRGDCADDEEPQVLPHQQLVLEVVQQ